MFALFYSLFLAMFKGSWRLYTLNEIFTTHVKNAFNALGTFLTSIFNDGASAYTTLGTDFFSSSENSYMNVVALVLATITSIGIVVTAVKGVKKAFGIFFGHIR